MGNACSVEQNRYNNLTFDEIRGYQTQQKYSSENWRNVRGNIASNNTPLKTVLEEESSSARFQFSNSQAKDVSLNSSNKIASFLDLKRSKPSQLSETKEEKSKENSLKPVFEHNNWLEKSQEHLSQVQKQSHCDTNGSQLRSDIANIESNNHSSSENYTLFEAEENFKAKYSSRYGSKGHHKTLSCQNYRTKDNPMLIEAKKDLNALFDENHEEQVQNEQMEEKVIKNQIHSSKVLIQNLSSANMNQLKTSSNIQESTLFSKKDQNLITPSSLITDNLGKQPASFPSEPCQTPPKSNKSNHYAVQNMVRQRQAHISSHKKAQSQVLPNKFSTPTQMKRSSNNSKRGTTSTPGHKQGHSEDVDFLEKLNKYPKRPDSMAKSNRELLKSDHKNKKSNHKKHMRLDSNKENEFNTDNIPSSTDVNMNGKNFNFKKSRQPSRISNYYPSHTDLPSQQMMSEQISIQNIHNSQMPDFPKNQDTPRMGGSGKTSKFESPSEEMASKISNFITREMFLETPMNKLNEKVIETMDSLKPYTPIQKYWPLFDDQRVPIFEKCHVSEVTFIGQMQKQSEIENQKDSLEKSKLGATSLKDNCNILNSFMSNKLNNDQDTTGFLEESKIASGLHTSKFRASRSFKESKAPGTPQNQFTKESQYAQNFNKQPKNQLIKHGFGVQAWPNGSIYIGFFSNGQRHHHGRLIFENGDYYEGEWQFGKANGYGKYVHEDGTVYEGEFIEDKQEGKGKEVWKDGSVYIGDFKDSLKWGQGCFVWKDGSMYKGGLIQNQLNGKGMNS